MNARENERGRTKKVDSDDPPVFPSRARKKILHPVQAIDVPGFAPDRFIAWARDYLGADFGAALPLDKLNRYLREITDRLEKIAHKSARARSIDFAKALRSARDTLLVAAMYRELRSFRELLEPSLWAEAFLYGDEDEEMVAAYWKKYARLTSRGEMDCPRM